MLGVVIGVASIVVMISLGLGLKQSMMEEMKKYSNLTTITVRTPYDSGKAGKDAEKKLLSDSTVEKFKELDHVVSVSPKLNMNATLKFGKYQVDAQLSGLPVERLQRMNINVGEGTLPQEGEDLKLFYGQYVLNSYYNPRNYVYPYYDSGQPLDWDLMARPTATYFPASSNNNSSSNSNEISGGGGGSNTTRKYLIPTAGVEASSGEYTSTSYDVYCDIDALITMVKKIYRNQAIPGQPTKKNGKPYKNIYYSEILVEVDDFQNVTDVQNLIKIMGYDAQSEAASRDQRLVAPFHHDDIGSSGNIEILDGDAVPFVLRADDDLFEIHDGIILDGFCAENHRVAGTKHHSAMGKNGIAPALNRGDDGAVGEGQVL